MKLIVVIPLFALSGCASTPDESPVLFCDPTPAADVESAPAVDDHANEQADVASAELHADPMGCGG